MLAGVAVAATAMPAAAACDAMSVGTPNKSGSNVRSSASICAATNWTAFVSIERWRGTWWDTIGSEQAIHGAGVNVTPAGPDQPEVRRHRHLHLPRQDLDDQQHRLHRRRVLGEAPVQLLMTRFPVRRPAGLSTGRLGVVVAVLALAGCASAPSVPGSLGAGWLQPGSLDIRFTAERWDTGGEPRTSQVHSVLTVGAGARVTAMQSTVTVDGIVKSSTRWHTGAAVETAQTPGCVAATTRGRRARDRRGVAGGDVRPGRRGHDGRMDGRGHDGYPAGLERGRRGTYGPGAVAPPDARAEQESGTGAVVGELSGIKIEHLPTAPAALPSCGEPAPHAVGATLSVDSFSREP